MFHRRVWILLGILLLGGTVVVLRLAQVQVLWSDMFRREAYTRAGGDRIVDTVRGGVYTRWGTPLARQSASFALGVLYDRLAEDGWRSQLSVLCGVPPDQLATAADEVIRRVERIQSAVQQRSGFDPGENYIRVVEQTIYHRVVPDVSPEIAAAVRCEPERFPGVRVMERAQREHPNPELAPHVVGLLQPLSAEQWDRFAEEGRAWTMSDPVADVARRYTMDDRAGASGIEKEYEELLRGRRGHVQNRLVFNVLSVQKESRQEPPNPGCDIYLTLREDFQRAAQQALERAASEEALDFHQGALVMVRVNTGAVLAAATWPSYDLNSYREDFPQLIEDPRHPLVFRPLQAALPTGSVYKVITALAALEKGAITAATTFYCTGRQYFGNRAFHCTGYHRHISLVPAIEKSCNIFFYNAARLAGGKALTQWGRNLGLGTDTGVDWPYERSGQVPQAHALHQVLNLSIGQGRLEATPLQVAVAMAAIANGGCVYTPHFLDHAVDGSGVVVKRYEPQCRDAHIHGDMLGPVRRGMRDAVSTGTASGVGLEPFSVAGKTGTAELGDSGLNHAWFAGYAPYEDPKIAFAVVNERVEGGHGGSHAAPIVAYCLEPIWSEVQALR